MTYNFRSSLELNVFEIAKIDDVGKSCNENYYKPKTSIRKQGR